MNNALRQQQLSRLDALYARMARNRADAARLLLQEARARTRAVRRTRR